jgi:hypothetical protein
MTTLNYQPRTTKQKRRTAVPVVFGLGVFFLIVAVVMLGEDLHFFATMDQPGYDWGPGQYVVKLMESLAVLGGSAMLLATLLILNGVRRVRQDTAAAALVRRNSEDAACKDPSKDDEAVS